MGGAGIHLFFFAAPALGAIGAALATGGAGLGSAWSLVLLILLPLGGVSGFAIGGGAGGLLAGLAIRLFSALACLPAGLRALPANWRRTLFAADTGLAPEVIPDMAAVNDDATFASFLSDIRTGNAW